MTHPTEKIKNYFPSIYKSILPSFFDKEIPQEKVANCDNCKMLAPPKHHHVKAQKYFSPKVKCCTRYPYLPNYLLGAYLNEGKSEYLNKRLSHPDGLFPQGLGPSSQEKEHYKQQNPNDFGRNLKYQCPHYNQQMGKCHIWSYRNSECSTYFCKSARGKAGKRFWQSLKEYMTNLERNISLYMLFKMNIPIHESLNENYQNVGDFNFFWEAQDIEPKEFYLQCFHHFKNLTKSEFKVNQLDFHQQYPQLQKEIEDHFKNLTTPSLPSLLRLNPQIRFEQPHNQQYIIRKGTEYFQISSLLFQILSSFDGQTPTETIIQNFSIKTGGLLLEEEMIKTFYQNEILREVAKP